MLMFQTFSPPLSRVRTKKIEFKLKENTKRKKKYIFLYLRVGYYRV